MATFYSNVRTNDISTPPVKSKSNQTGGRVRSLVASYTVPATGGPAVGDVIEWGILPVGSRVLGHASKLFWSAGAATSTVSVGDSASSARHLAQTGVTTAGSALTEAASANGGSFEASGATTVTSTVAGAALGAGQVLTLHMQYVIN